MINMVRPKPRSARGRCFVECIPVHEFISLEKPGSPAHQPGIGAAVEPLLHDGQGVALKRARRRGEEIKERDFFLRQAKALAENMAEATTVLTPGWKIDQVGSGNLSV